MCLQVSQHLTVLSGAYSTMEKSFNLTYLLLMLTGALLFYFKYGFKEYLVVLAILVFTSFSYTTETVFMSVG